MHTILIVDDEPAVVEALAAQLLPLGAWIEGAYSGVEGLSLLEREPAVIIADYLMPGMRGDDFLIEAHRRFPRSRLILLTGQAGAENIGRIVNHARLFRYIAKPWEVEDLRLTVREALHSYESERELEERTRLGQGLLAYLQAILSCETLDALLELRSSWEARLFSSGGASTAQEEAKSIFFHTSLVREAHLRLLEELEQQVQSRTADLAQALKELKALSSQREAWIKIVSHDLRGPLSGLRHLAVLLRQDGSDPSAFHRYTSIFQESLTELERYVKNLLDLSRLSQGEIVFQKEPFSWVEMARRLHALILPQLEVKGIKWRAEVAPLESWGDPTYTAEALYNILSNAVKFTPRGGTVMLRVQPEEGGVLVEISDTGIGMEPEEVAALWEPGKRRSRLGTDGEKGTGLGLPLAHAILTQQGVSIEVVSAPGRGTTFYLHWRSFAECES
ncbi:MAG: hybrid sensor histidine kinase/response regulator [Bacteroidia bacterium]|nr:hybrid sensor histidine kinase/response regulator [Bacteroidia bacterium]MDW8014562.1 hybrid sensor histidine kinase/response regulator [Bacteroidia bacterium]